MSGPSPLPLTPEQEAAALAHFTDYFVRNYPGPHTVIHRPEWHAPKLFRAAQYAVESAVRASLLVPAEDVVHPITPSAGPSSSPTPSSSDASGVIHTRREQ